MTDPNNEIERLRKLEADGALSGAEFEVEMARLRDAETVPPEPTRGTSRVLVAVGSIVGLIGVGASVYLVAGRDAAQDIRQERLSAPRSSAPPKDTQPAADTSLWQTNFETDPMTDETIQSASAQLHAEAFMVKTMVSCRASHEIVYRFTAFDTNGQPVDFRRTFMVVDANPYQVADATFRFDREPPIPLRDINTRYTNQFELSEDFKVGGLLDPTRLDRIERWLTALRVTVQLELEAGQPIIVIDQTDPVVRAVVSACAGGIARSKRAAVERKEANHQACLARQATQLAQAKKSVGTSGDTYGQDTPYETCN